MAKRPEPTQPSRLEAARGRVVAARWLLAIAAGAGFGWALLGAKLANPGSGSPPSDARDAPAATTGAAVPASVPATTPAPAGSADADELLDGFFGDAAVAPDAGPDDGAAPDEAAPTPSRTFTSPDTFPSRTSIPRSRTHAS